MGRAALVGSRHAPLPLNSHDDYLLFVARVANPNNDVTPPSISLFEICVSQTHKVKILSFRNFKESESQLRGESCCCCRLQQVAARCSCTLSKAKVMSSDTSTTLRQLASLLGASGVGLGAFGAHGKVWYDVHRCA